MIAKYLELVDRHLQSRLESEIANMYAFADIAICSRINVAVPFSHRQRCGISFKISAVQFLQAAAPSL